MIKRIGQAALAFYSNAAAIRFSSDLAMPNLVASDLQVATATFTLLRAASA
jgi:hypothetical protein